MLLTAISVFSQMPPIGPGVSHDLAIWRAAHYSDVRYKLNLTLEKMSPVLKGTIEIRVKVEEKRSGGEKETAPTGSEPGAVATGFLPQIILDWRKIAGHEKDSMVSNLTINGVTVQSASFSLSSSSPGEERDKSRTLNYGEDQEHLIFRDGVRMGENVIKLDFTSPILTSGSAITRYVDKEDGSEYIYSLFVPSDASTAFPVFDQPDLKARFLLNLRKPASWKCAVVSNANSVSEDFTNGWATTEFEETKPISTYVFAFAIGSFAQFRQLESGETINYDKVVAKTFNGREFFVGDEIQKRIGKLQANSIYVRKSQAEKFNPHAAKTFGLMREGVKYLETYFDYKFPFPKYDLVLIPEFPFGGMEHAGATFVREQSIIFPTEPTKSDYINRAVLIFHETAHQWFGDTVTMKWFDDLWLKEGFANFMAYKAMEKIMPETNAWKVFYERIKQPAYATDSTKGTTAIYQPIENLSAAKSAYGNIVYNKAPAFLRQAEFYLGEDKFQTAVRAFLKKHEYANAGWEDLVKEFEAASGEGLKEWADGWIKTRGGPVVTASILSYKTQETSQQQIRLEQYSSPSIGWPFKTIVYWRDEAGNEHQTNVTSEKAGAVYIKDRSNSILFAFANYQDYGYGIFLLDDKSRDYVLKNVANEKDPFLRSMMYGALWDSVREAELDPKDYIELVIKNLGSSELRLEPRKTITPKGVTLNGEDDETIIQSLLGRVGTAMNYYLSEAQRTAIAPRLEAVLLDRLQHSETPGQRITFYRAYVANATTASSRVVLKEMLRQGGAGQRPADALRAGSPRSDMPTLRTKDRFDIITRLAILGDPDAPKLLATLEKTETGDDAKRYAYAAHAAFGTAENKAKFWNDFINNKDISESWIEAAMGPFNNIRHAGLTQQYLTKALAELPNLKRTRKIFFVNGWLGAFLGGQRDQAALDAVNKFLADNPTLDRDLRLKILENVDLIERAVKIRGKYGKN